MCGICGAISLAGYDLSERSQSIVLSMLSLQNHRGPDNAAFISYGPAIVAANRLRISEQSSESDMPMLSLCKKFSIVYNGEIYNHHSVRKELIELGYRFRTKSDTEVLVNGFAQWGCDVTKKITGMYAFAIYSIDENRLFLARDRLGKKPLYYALKDGALYFASEMKALVKHSDTKEISKHLIPQWSLYRSAEINSTETLAHGIHTLPAGHYIFVHSGGGIFLNKYFDTTNLVNEEIYAENALISQRELVNKTEAIICDSVISRLDADCTIGTLCSGGVDSGLVTALASSVNKGITAYNVSVQDPGAENEHEYAVKIASHLNISLNTLYLSRSDFLMNLTRAIYHNDGPLSHPSAVFHMLMYDYARADGAQALLSGEGADELFGGYRYRYRKLLISRQIEKILNYIPVAIRNNLKLLTRLISGYPEYNFIGYDGLPFHMYDMLDFSARKSNSIDIQNAYSFISSEAERSVLSHMLNDLSFFLPTLLTRQDRTSMAASIELRSPYLDDRLLMHMANIEMKQKVGFMLDKPLLKKIAAKHIPKDAVYRAKMGFSLPIGYYLEPISQTKIMDDGFCVNSLQIRNTFISFVKNNYVKNADAFFNMLNIEIWGRMAFLGQSQEEINRLLLS